MKQFKLFLWIFALVLIRTVISVFFNIRGIVPDLLFAFTAAYATYEKSLRSVMWVTVICGVLSSAMGAAPFGAVMLMFVYSAAIQFMLYQKFHRMTGAVRAMLGTAVFTAAGECIINLVLSMSFSMTVLTGYILPMVILNMLLAAVIYILLAKCFDKHDIASKLLI